MTQQKNQTITTIRDAGRVKATIWAIQSQNNGTFYSMEISRTYKKGEAFHDAHSLSGTDLLVAARLHKARAIADLRRLTVEGSS